MTEHSLVYTTKFACDRCGREVIVNLFARSDHPIDDKIREEVVERSKKEHQCKSA